MICQRRYFYCIILMFLVKVLLNIIYCMSCQTVVRDHLLLWDSSAWESCWKSLRITICYVKGSHSFLTFRQVYHNVKKGGSRSYISLKSGILAALHSDLISCDFFQAIESYLNKCISTFLKTTDIF